MRSSNPAFGRSQGEPRNPRLTCSLAFCGFDSCIEPGFVTGVACLGDLTIGPEYTDTPLENKPFVQSASRKTQGRSEHSYAALQPCLIVYVEPQHKHVANNDYSSSS